MNSKRWITFLLVFCLVLGNIAPAAGAVSVGAGSGVAPNRGVIDGLLDAAEKVLGITLRDDKSHLQNLDGDVLSLVSGKWMATLADGKTVELTEAQLPTHIQELQKMAGDYQPMDIVTAFVVLKDAPTADSYRSINAVPQELTAQLEAKQAQALAAIRQDVGEVEVVSSFTHLTNAIVVRTAFGNLEKMAAVAGVKSVFLNPVYKARKAEEVAAPFTVSSANMTNVSSVWHDLGYTGKGMTVAILDTGLDLDHPSFAATPEDALWTPEMLQNILDTYDLNAELLYEYVNGEELTVKDMYFSGKIPYIFNYATGTTNVSHNDGVGDHGTHVAGIAAANALEGSSVTGMAPDAQVFAMKVFSPEGGAAMDTIVMALEDCMTMGVDVANMSLGSAAGFSESGHEEIDAIFQRIAESDLIVDVAVGNEGNSGTMTNYGYYTMPTKNIDNGTVASPATYANSMGVASVDNTMIAADYFALADGYEVFYRYSVDFMLGTVGVTIYHLTGLGDFEYVIVDGLGYPADFYDEAGNSLVAGKVAVIRRGDISFGEKCLAAEEAGAVAALIWNQDDSYIFDFNMSTAVTLEDGSEIVPQIPVAMISLEDGQKMAEAENKLMNVPGDYSFREDKYGGQMSSFSCWGTTPDLRLLPDLSGIGGNVYSTIDGGYYGLMSGTSMACPQVAGVTALVLQYLREAFPNATEAETRVLVDALLMSTATTVIDHDSGLEASPRQQGAGLIDALGAITAEAYLSVAGSERPKAELGESEAGEYTFTFSVHNYSDAPKTYTLRSSLLCEDYVENPAYPGMFFLAEQEHALDNSGVSFSRSSVTVAPGGSEEVTVTIKLTDADKEWIHTYFPSGNYVEGYVYLEGEGEVTLSLPFMGFFERWDEAPLFDTGFWYEEGMWNIPGAEITADLYYHLFWTSLGGTDGLLGLNPYMDNMIYDEWGNVIGMTPFKMENMVVSPNGDGALDMITDMYISILRNLGEMDMIFEDEDGNVLWNGLLYRDSKTMYNSGYGQIVPLVYSWFYEGLYDFSGLEDGDVVYLSMAGRIDQEDAEYDVLLDKMPIYIDLAKPVLDVNSVKESSENGRNYLTFTFADAHPAAAILMNKSGTQIYSYYGDDEMIDNGDGTYTVTVDVTNLGSEITVALCDYGCNEAFYDLQYTQTDNNPEVDKDALYAYQIYNEAIYSYYGWDAMFGWAHMDRVTGEVSMINSDAYEYYSLVAAEYVDGLVFAVDAGYNFLYMVPGLWNRTEICNLGVNVLDMAWDEVTNTMYVTTKTETGMDYPSHTYALYTLDIMTGVLTEVTSYMTSYYAPHAMTFVDGKLYAAIAERAGLFEVDVTTGKATQVKVNDENVVPKASNGNDAIPEYSQSMTYSKADGKIYWAYYGQTTDLIVIDPTDWSSTATAFATNSEYVGLLTMEEDAFEIPASEAVTRVAISDSEVLLKLGQQYGLRVKLLPWNAPITGEVVWSSSDETIATVDQDGIVTAIGEGNAIITASYGELTASCEVMSVDTSGNLFAYNLASGLGFGDWLNIDLGNMTQQSLYLSDADFLAADYNGHDGFIYGYDQLGQLYRQNPETGETETVGTAASVQMLDMAYDYSSGVMYGVAYDAALSISSIYYINLQTGALVKAGDTYDALMTLACDTEGNLYGISTGGLLYSLIRVEGELGGGGVAPLNQTTYTGEAPTSYYYELLTITTMPVQGLVYAQSMCYDHNNDVLVWSNPETGTIFRIKPGEYVLAMGEPSGTGFIQYVGLFVIPDEIPELAYVPVESISGQDMLVLTDSARMPAVDCAPLNATNQAGVVYVSADETIAKVENGMIVGVSVGTTTVTATLTDTAPDGTVVTHEATFTVTVKLSTDNIYGYLVQDMTYYNGYCWIGLNDNNPGQYNIEEMVYDGATGAYYTLYCAEYVNGVIYAYGFDDQDWNANFKFMTINPETWSITSMKDMGDEFPFVYDMAFDYTTGTMYAVAGSTSATSLHIVNLNGGSLIECMSYEPFLMSLAIDEKGTIYGMARSQEDYDPMTWTSTFDTARMYTLNVAKGSCEEYMDTGVICNQMASMAYDFDTGYIYWTGFYVGSSYVTGLHLIDPADKTCFNLGTIGGHSQVTGLMIFAEEYPEVPTTLQNALMVTPMLEVNVGSTVAAELFMAPATAEVKIKWNSDNPAVATVDENGVITGVASGSAIVTAMIQNDKGKVITAQATIHVYLPEDDHFLVYNRDDLGFSAIDRTDVSVVTNLTEGEEGEMIRSMEMVNGVIYGFDDAGNFFTISRDKGFDRAYLGSHNVEVKETYEEVEDYGEYIYHYVYTPNFVVRDLSWDAANNRMLALGARTLIKESYYVTAATGEESEHYVEELETVGGCAVYEVNLETGALTMLTKLYTESGEDYSGVYALAVTDKGVVYAYSTFMDYIGIVNMENGLTSSIATFQNLGYYGDSDCAPMAMTYDPVTNNIYVLFTQNGNAYFLFKYNVTTTLISSVGSIGTEYDDCAGLIIDRHSHSYKIVEVLQEGDCQTPGKAVFQCECGHIYTGETELADHDYAYGYCQLCGAVDMGRLSLAFQDALDRLDYGYTLDADFMAMTVNDILIEANGNEEPLTVPADEYEAMIDTYFVLTEEIRQELRTILDYNEADDTYTIMVFGGMGGSLSARDYVGYVKNGDTYDVYYGHITYSYLEDVWAEETDFWTYVEQQEWPETITYKGVVYEAGPEGYFKVESYDNYGKVYTVELNGNIVRILSSADYTAEDLPEKFDDALVVEVPGDDSVIIPDSDVFEDGATVKVEQVEEGEIFDAAQDAMEFVAESYTVFEFTAYKDGAAVQPNGALSVTFAIPEDYSDNVAVYYMDADGKLQKLEGVVDAENRTITVELTHFSTYILVDAETAPDFQLGDVNGDGRVNARDVRALLRYIAGLEESAINEAAADFNGDGRINARDVRALLRSIAGLD